MTHRSSCLRRRPTAILAAGAAAALACVFAADAARAQERERTEVVRREIALRPDVREVAIDNTLGAVRVVAGAAGRVAFEIVQRVEARSDAALDDAFREVSLDVVDQGERLELIQDGPFRCHERRARANDWRDGGCHWDPAYRVRWEWRVEVPPSIDLVAGTVNGGALEVDGVTGRVAASNVNGPLRLAGLGGRVDATTVNGELIAEFARAPEGDSRFETVNGRVELTLPRDTSADVGFETMHGKIYTDFEVTPLPSRAVVARDSRARYRFDRTTVVRIGNGGVRLDCETLNGDIVLRAR